MTTSSKHLEGYHGIFIFLYYWLPPMLLTAGILALAGDLGSVSKFRWPIAILKYLLPSLSRQEIYQIYAVLRKIGHFLAYGLLFFSYVRAWWWHVRLSRWHAILLALAVCLLVAVADESRQAGHTSRTGSVRDVALDMSGALAAAMVVCPFLKAADRDDPKKLAK